MFTSCQSVNSSTLTNVFKVSSFLAGYIAKKRLKFIFYFSLLEWGRVGREGTVRGIERERTEKGG